jgi:hypothetical protein
MAPGPVESLSVTAARSAVVNELILHLLVTES